MFKKILLAVFLAFSANVTAQIYLPNPVKEQTGTYFVQGDYITNFGQFIPNTGVTLEIVEPTFRLSPVGPIADQTFVFGTYYRNDGTYFVFSGYNYFGNKTEVALSQVTEDGQVESIGVGELIVDPFSNGDAHNIMFTFEFNDGVQSGAFVRSTNVPINRCKMSVDFSPYDPFDKPCMIPTLVGVE